MAAAAVGATHWAPKADPVVASSRRPVSKQATHDPRSRTVTVRSGRRGRDTARERVYVVPADRLSAPTATSRR